MWPRILAGAPLAALLVLFDLLIDNPSHPETAANLALLDVGSGHFSGLEYASQGTLPGSIASEFAQIARSYVRERTGLAPENTALQALSPPATVASDDQMADMASDVQTLNSASNEMASFPMGWNVRAGTEGMIEGTDMLDLFGTYFPTWDEDCTFGTANMYPTV